MATQPWVPSGSISLPFGVSEAAIGGPTHHTGIDVSARKGTPIISQISGRVTATTTGQSNTYPNGPVSYGNDIIIAFKSATENFTLILGHLQDVYVKAGDIIKPGQILGTVGSTGYATGPHLHFEVRNSGGNAIDPSSFLNGSVMTSVGAGSTNPLDLVGAINNFSSTVQGIPGTVASTFKPTLIGVGIGSLAVLLIIAGIFVIIAPTLKTVAQNATPIGRAIN
jgi:hypothetical protein